MFNRLWICLDAVSLRKRFKNALSKPSFHTLEFDKRIRIPQTLVAIIYEYVQDLKI